MGQKGNYNPKFATETKRHSFDTTRGSHAMIAIPQKVNEVTGYGEVFSMGVSKAKACCENIIALKQFVADNPDEANRQIEPEAHEGKEWD